MADEVFRKVNLIKHINKPTKRFSIPDTIQETPGPGYYYHESKKPSKRYNAVFVSNIRRELFPSIKGEDSIECEYDIGSLGNESKLEKGGGNRLFIFGKVDPEEKPVFQSNSSRFTLGSLGGVLGVDSPGPGYYNARNNDKVKGYISTIGDRSSFIKENFTPGPGFYNNIKID